jgi:hypothetical protein
VVEATVTAVRKKTRKVRASADDEWQKACNDVVSAFSAAEVHAEFLGHKPEAISSDEIASQIKAYLPRARKLFAATDVHRPNDLPCGCRHATLIFVAAQKEAEATGKPMLEIFHTGKNVLNWYLKTVS